MKTISIEGGHPYSIDIGYNLFPQYIEYIARWLNRYRPVIVADRTVARHHAPFLDNFITSLGAEYISFPAGERCKTRAYKQKIEDVLLKTGCGRDTYLIAFGGGVTTDLVGFIAATYCRGIPVIYMPTSLLAMVDASIGGKTGVNTPYGKNLVGAFYSPCAVVMDVAFLRTLPWARFQEGLVELIKHALIHDASFFTRLEAHILEQSPEQYSTDWLIDVIVQSCLIKKELVMQDEYDTGIRQWLNFGHTIGHALEQVSYYRIRHGQAVACGMVCASLISLQLGLLPRADFERIQALFIKLKILIPLDTYADKILDTLVLDKKAVGGRPRFVLLEKIGVPYQENGLYTCEVPESLIRESLCTYLSPFKCWTALS